MTILFFWQTMLIFNNLFRGTAKPNILLKSCFFSSVGDRMKFRHLFLQQTLHPQGTFKIFLPFSKLNSHKKNQKELEIGHFSILLLFPLVKIIILIIMLIIKRKIVIKCKTRNLSILSQIYQYFYCNFRILCHVAIKAFAISGF